MTDQEHQNSSSPLAPLSGVRSTAVRLLDILKSKAGFLVISFCLFGAGIWIGASWTQETPTAPDENELIVENTSEDQDIDSESISGESDSLIASESYDEDIAIEDEPTELSWKELTVARGDGLMEMLAREDVPRSEAYKAIKALRGHFDVRKLQIGQVLNAGFDAENTLQQLTIEKDFHHMVEVSRDKDTYKAQTRELPTMTITRHAEGVIQDSLFLAAQKEGLPNVVIVDLIRIFSFDVDFQREMRRDDKFEIYYERHLSEDGRRVREGDILYAKLTLSGKEVALYKYQPTDKKYPDYFHQNGQSARKALMKTPIEGARLTSRYGPRRHPVLGFNRMHKGLDFGAPTGTPIMAAGDGVIEKSRRFGAYGKYVRIRHNSTYKTAYAHLSRYGKGVKEGRRVKQGQIIGYVGATGRVTGPHLHYEVLKDGRQVNPLRLKIPTGIKLKGPEKEKFSQFAILLDQEIFARKNHILLAARIEQFIPKDPDDS